MIYNFVAQKTNDLHYYHSLLHSPDFWSLLPLIHMQHLLGNLLPIHLQWHLNVSKILFITHKYWIEIRTCNILQLYDLSFKLTIAIKSVTVLRMTWIIGTVSLTSILGRFWRPIDISKGYTTRTLSVSIPTSCVTYLITAWPRVP